MLATVACRARPQQWCTKQACNVDVPNTIATPTHQDCARRLACRTRLRRWSTEHTTMTGYPKTPRRQGIKHNCSAGTTNGDVGVVQVWRMASPGVEEMGSIFLELENICISIHCSIASKEERCEVSVYSQAWPQTKHKARSYGLRGALASTKQTRPFMIVKIQNLLTLGRA